MPIHPTAIVDPSARVAESADIGPYCIIGPDVEIGARTRLIAQVFTDGPLTIGENNTFYPYSSIGAAPQDLKYKGERSRVQMEIEISFESSSPYTAGPRAAECSPASAATCCCRPTLTLRMTAMWVTMRFFPTGRLWGDTSR